MAYTNNDGVDITKPNGAADAAEAIDTFIQDVKKAVIERMDYLLGGSFASSTEQTIEKLRGVAEFFGAGKQAVQPVTALGNISGTVALDFDVRGNYITATLTDATTFTFANLRPGTTYLLFLKQDATGGRGIFFPASMRWPGGTTTPTFNTVANSLTVITITPYGSVALGNVAGTGYNVS